MDAPEFFLSIVDGGPPAPGIHPGYLLSIYLAKRNPATCETEVWGGNAWPHIVEWAKDVVIGFGNAAIKHSFLLRADPAGVVADTDVWPRWCVTEGQWRTVVDQLIGIVHSTSDASLYPLSIWLVPARDQAGGELIEEFRANRFDKQLWDDLMARGVMRVAVDDNAITVQGATQNRQFALSWLREIIAGLPKLNSTTEWESYG